MEKIFNILSSGVHLFAALILVALSLFIMGGSVYEVLSNIREKTEFIPLMLQSVGAIIIAAAIVDVAKFDRRRSIFE